MGVYYFRRASRKNEEFSTYLSPAEFEVYDILRGYRGRASSLPPFEEMAIAYEQKNERVRNHPAMTLEAYVQACGRLQELGIVGVGNGRLEVLQKLLSPSPSVVIYKTGGFYVTDNKKPERQEEEKKEL